MSGFKTQTKRNREAAKLAKRQAKDQKRAQRKAERAGEGAPASPLAVSVSVPAAPLASAPKPSSTWHGRPVIAPAAPASKPLTFSEAVERWKNTKVAKPKRN